MQAGVRQSRAGPDRLRRMERAGRWDWSTADAGEWEKEKERESDGAVIKKV